MRSTFFTRIFLFEWALGTLRDLGRVHTNSIDMNLHIFLLFRAFLWLRTSLIPNNWIFNPIDFSNSTKQHVAGSNLLLEEPLWIYLNHFSLILHVQIEPTNRLLVLWARIICIPYNANLYDSYRFERLPPRQAFSIWLLSMVDLKELASCCCIHFPSIMPSESLARIAVAVPFLFTHFNM